MTLQNLQKTQSLLFLVFPGNKLDDYFWKINLFSLFWYYIYKTIRWFNQLLYVADAICVYNLFNAGKFRNGPEMQSVAAD